MGKKDVAEVNTISIDLSKWEQTKTDVELVKEEIRSVEALNRDELDEKEKAKEYSDLLHFINTASDKTAARVKMQAFIYEMYSSVPHDMLNQCYGVETANLIRRVLGLKKQGETK